QTPSHDLLSPTPPPLLLVKGGRRMQARCIDPILCQGSSVSSATMMRPMGKKLSAAPVSKKKLRGPKSATTLPPNTALSAPTTMTKKGIQIKNQVLQHSAAMLESKQDDGAAAGPATAPGAGAAGAPSESARPADAEAAGPQHQNDAHDSVRGGSPPRAGDGRPTGEAEGSSVSSATMMRPMGKKLSAAPVSKKKLRGPKSATTLPPNTALSAPTTMTKKGIQIKNQVLQHSAAMLESKQDDGAAAGPATAPGAGAAGAPSESARPADAEAAGPQHQNDAHDSVRGGSPPRAGDGRPTGEAEGSSVSSATMMRPMGKKLSAAPVSKKKLRGPKSATTLPPNTALSAPTTMTKKGIQIKNQVLQHSAAMLESKQDDGAAAGPATAPGAGAAGAPSESARPADAEAAGPQHQNDAHDSVRGGSPPRAGDGRPTGEAEELAAQVEQSHPPCPSAGCARAPDGGPPPQSVLAGGGVQPEGAGPPSVSSRLPRGTWRRYREPGTNRLWFLKEATGESFFADSPGAWRQYAGAGGRTWWWSQESNTSFWEDECDGAAGDDDGVAEEGASWDDLEALGLQHLRRKVHLEPCLKDGGEVRSAIRYSGKTWEFHVVLFRSNSNDKLGLNFILDQDSHIPVISQVKDVGMCASHNLEMQQFPEESPLHQMQVAAGDKVKVVNGFTSAEDIRNELTNALVVHLRVVRPGHSPEMASTRGRAAGTVFQ
ncbi:unnamed protein product, partial [Prorocentrum cordatum]